MKRLTTFTDNSYMPLWQEDLKFIQDNMIQALTQLGKTFSYGNSIFIINGCVLTNNGTHYSVTEGLIMVQGELLYCPAQTEAMVSGLLPFLIRQELTDSNGAKQMILSDQTVVTKQTWDVNYAKLVMDDGSIISPKLSLTNAVSLPDRVEAAMMNDSGWVDMVLNWGFFESMPVKRRKYGKIVTLCGTIDAEGSSGLMCSVPAAWAPPQTMAVESIYYNMFIETSGDIYYVQKQEAATVLFDFINWII